MNRSLFERILKVCVCFCVCLRVVSAPVITREQIYGSHDTQHALDAVEYYGILTDLNYLPQVFLIYVTDLVR